MEKLIGSINQNEVIQGLLLARSIDTLGDIWEQLLDCNHCMFKTQCKKIGDAMEQLNKYPTCGQIVDMLMGELKPEDIPVRGVLDF
jgi:hypothetical protein